MTALLLGLAVVLLLPCGSGRLRAVLPRPARAGTAAGTADAAGGAVRRAGPVAACALAGGAAAVLLGGELGVLAGCLLLGLGPRLLGRLEPREQRQRADDLAADLPLALDLLAACLAGGAVLRDAVEAVARASRGDCAARLWRVADALAVGSAPELAWGHLAAGAAPTDLAASAARTLVRASTGGAPPAAAVARLAADARAEGRALAEQRARRVGVLAVLPLGVCFLPAFVLLGVVPVVVGMAGPLLSAL